MSDNLTPLERAQTRMNAPKLPPYAQRMAGAPAPGPNVQMYTPEANPQIAPKQRVHEPEGEELSAAAMAAAAAPVSPQEQARREYVNRSMAPEAPAAAPEAAAPSEPKEPAPEAQRPNCAHCGHDPQVATPHPTLEEKRNFRRHLYGMGKVPFLKSYPLMDGELVVRLRSRSARVDRLCAEQCLREIRDGRIFTGDAYLAASAYGYRLSRLQMACSIDFVSSVGTVYPCIDTPEAAAMWPEVKDGGKLVDGAVAVAERTLVEEWPSALLMMVNDVWQEFESLLRHMTVNAPNPSFWEGIDGRS